MTVISHDGQLVRTLPRPVPAADRNRLRGARRARPMPPQPGWPHHGAAAGVVPGFTRWPGPARKDGDVSA
jgi:hypothetical protein